MHIQSMLLKFSLILCTIAIQIRSEVVTFKICDPFHNPSDSAVVVLKNRAETHVSNDSGLIKVTISPTFSDNSLRSGKGTYGNLLSVFRGVLTFTPFDKNVQAIISVFDVKGRILFSRNVSTPTGTFNLDLYNACPSTRHNVSIVKVLNLSGSSITNPVLLLPAGIASSGSVSALPRPDGLGKRTSAAVQFNDTLSINKPGFEQRTTRISITLPVPSDSAIEVMIKPLQSQIPDSLIRGLAEKYGLPKGTVPSYRYVLPGDNIQRIINQAKFYDIINVAAGTYYLDSTVVLHSPVVLRSIDGPRKTIIDGQNKSRCFLMEVSNTVLDGFTIQHGDASGPNNWGTSESETECDDGGAVFTCGCMCSGYSPGPLPLIMNCVIVNNKAGTMGGGGLHLKGGTVRNCLIAFNKAWRCGGGIAIKQWPVVIENTTIAMNSTGWWFNTGMRTIFKNSILALNNRVNWDASQEAGTVCFWHSLTEKEGRLTDIEPGVYDTIGAIEADPLFKAASDSDFTLLPNSPCRNAGSFLGDTVLQRTLLFDLNGNPRVSGKQIDIGAFEFKE